VNDLKDELLWTWVQFPPPPPNNMKKTLLLILFLLIPTNIFATNPVIKGLDTFEVVKDKLHQTATWHKMPAIVVCTHAPVEKEKVQKSIKFWKKLGYRFHSSVYFKESRSAEACMSDNPVGYIVIDLVTQKTFGNYDDMAITHFYIDNRTREIHWARIYLKTNVEERVLEHELGHALGWMHSTTTGHLMHKKWVHGGWKIDGLKK
tara:strand:- start:1996 stop:2610 length:615 start_codon:yes stop_codon:yes gene_type:complete